MLCGSQRAYWAPRIRAQRTAMVALSCNESSKCPRGSTPLLYGGGRKPKPSAFLFAVGSVCETLNHRGHEGTRRKTPETKAFVVLRVLGGSGLCELHRETDPLPLVCSSGTEIPVRVQSEIRFMSDLPHVGSAPWSHHREYRAGQGQDHCGHGDGAAGRWAGDARPDAAVSEGLVALRGTRCGQGFRRQVHPEADGTRLRKSRRREARP